MKRLRWKETFVALINQIVSSFKNLDLNEDFALMKGSSRIRFSPKTDILIWREERFIIYEIKNLRLDVREDQLLFRPRRLKETRRIHRKTRKRSSRSYTESESVKSRRKWKWREVSFLSHSSKSSYFHLALLSFHFFVQEIGEHHNKIQLPLKAGLSKANSCFAFSGSSSDTNFGSGKEEERRND